MPEDPIIKDIDDLEIPEALGLHNHYYDDHRTIDQWEWEYKGHYPDLSVFCVLKDDGHVVGTCGAIPIDLNVSGETILSYKMENLLRHEQYQGLQRHRGLAEKLYLYTLSRAATKGCAIAWAYTGATRTLKRWGPKLVDVMYDSVVELNSPPGLRTVSRLWSRLRHVKASAKAVCSFVKRQTAPSRRFAIKPGLAPASLIADLFKRIRQTFPELIHIEFNETYVRWRITEHPFIRYSTFSIYEGDTLRGFAVVNGQNKQFAYLADLVFDDDSAGVTLLSSIVDDLRKRHYLSLNYLGNMTNPVNARTLAVLRMFSAVETPNPKMAFALMALSDAAPRDLYDVSRWHMSGLWTEGYVI